MTEDEVRAAAERLVRFHERFAPLFGKEQAQDHAYTYVKGLMVCPERKSVEPIALNVGDGQVSALQKFLNIAPWDHGDVQAEVHSVFADELVPTAADSPIGTVGVVDESGFTKKGEHSAGVARQHNGRLGKEDNCQVGVFLVGVTPGGVTLLDHALYLPETWCEDTPACRDRRAKVHIPEAVAFETKPQIAARLVRQTAALGVVALDWITADEEYGRNGGFLDELRRWSTATSSRSRSTPRSGPRTRPRVSRPTAVAGGYRRGPAARRCRAWPRWPRPCRPNRGGLCRSVRAPGGRWPSSSPRCGCGRCAMAPPARRSGWWCGGRWRRRPRSSTTSATATPRRPWSSWRKWPAPVTRSRSSSRTPRATWAWRSTRRGRGSAGIIT